MIEAPELTKENRSKLIVGAEALAEELYDGDKTARAIYELYKTNPRAPLFKHNGQIAGLRDSLWSWLREEEQRSLATRARRADEFEAKRQAKNEARKRKRAEAKAASARKETGD